MRGGGRVAVSIVAYHTDGDELRRAVSCIDRDVAGSVCIVDNAREKRVEALAAELGVRYVGSANSGYGAGHNIAIRQSIERGADYHLVMNSDVEFAPEDLARMVARMDSDQGIGALQPRIVGADGADQYTVRMLPTPFDLVVRRFLPAWMFRRSRDRYLLKHLDRDREHCVHYMQGSFMLLRVDTLKRVGGFDERFFMYPEDIDLTRRIAADSRALYWPGAVVRHLHRAESYASGRMLWVHVVNMVRYFNKWGWWTDSGRRRANGNMR